MILITGATGHLGKATIDFLLKKGISANNIAALVRDEAKAADLKALGITLRKGDITIMLLWKRLFHNDHKPDADYNGKGYPKIVLGLE